MRIIKQHNFTTVEHFIHTDECSNTIGRRKKYICNVTNAEFNSLNYCKIKRNAQHKPLD